MEACGDCAFSCRRVLWRAHTSSPRGATAVGVSFLLEVTLSQPALPIGSGLITWALGCTFGTQLTVCVKYSGAKFLGVDFGRLIGLCRLLVLRKECRSRFRVSVTDHRDRLRVVPSRGGAGRVGASLEGSSVLLEHANLSLIHI